MESWPLFSQTACRDHKEPTVSQEPSGEAGHRCCLHSRATRKVPEAPTRGLRRGPRLPAAPPSCTVHRAACPQRCPHRRARQPPSGSRRWRRWCQAGLSPGRRRRGPAGNPGGQGPGHPCTPCPTHPWGIPGKGVTENSQPPEPVIWQTAGHTLFQQVVQEYEGRMETGTRTPAPHSTTPRGPRRPPSMHPKGQGLGGEVFPPGAGRVVPGPLVGRAGQAASPCGPRGPWIR